MTLKMMKAPTQARVNASEMLSSPASVSTYPTIRLLLQEPVDPVAWIAARANVAVATARVHAELFGIGGAA